MSAPGRRASRPWGHAGADPASYAVAVTYRNAWRRDLARRETPTDRTEFAFLSIGAIVIAVAAQASDPGPAEAVLGLSPAVGVFVLRGLMPRLAAEVFAAAVIVPVMLVVGADGDLELSMFLMVIMVLYVAWHLGSVTRAVVITAVAAVAPVIIVKVLAPGAGISWVPWTSACGFTYVLGRALFRQQALIDDLERARGALAEQAVAEERRRIARELHDLAGHTLAAMLLHVTGARHVLRRDLDEAERALAEAEDVGRSSLDQIRGTVASLRTVERGTDPPALGSADLAALIEEYRRAGLRIDARIPGDVGSVSAAVGVGLHRIVRESLANVARHAPANAVRIDLALEAESVRLSVRDRGSAPALESANVAHFGLVGMSERARALGGVVAAGPTEDGWAVDATLPLRPMTSTAAGTP